MRHALVRVHALLMAGPTGTLKYAVSAGWVAAAALPLVGLVSLLWRTKLDPSFDSARLHFVLFLLVGLCTSLLAVLAGGAAQRRGDARVLLLSLAFLTTGSFMGLHALGTQGVLVTRELAGLKVAIPVGLLLAAVFGAASAFVDLRPAYAGWVIRHRRALRGSVAVALLGYVAWTYVQWPPLDRPGSEGSFGVLAVLGTALYGAAALRYLAVHRQRPGLLPASVVACFVLLAESMIGVAVTGERAWHASWWLWHALIVLAYLIVLFAAQLQWRDERFRGLYLSTTRERSQDVSVLFSDLSGYTSFSERTPPDEVAEMLHTYYAVAAPLLSRRFGGELEKFMGDGLFVTFNSRGDQPDHAVLAARAALALQAALSQLADEHAGWPRLRVGVNSGPAAVREMGGHGFVAYTVVGDTVNLASRLEGQAPVGGVLIGSGTYRELPEGTVVEPRLGLQVKGKQEPVDAYVLAALPDQRGRGVATLSGRRG